MILHPFLPLFDKNSKILILGSFPSVKSRQINFYYGHPQNRFWKVISAIFNEIEPKTIEEKKLLVLSNNIALWDSIKSCDIVNSSDSSIKDVQINDIKGLIDNTNINKVIFNGNTSYKMFKKYNKENFENIKFVCLPSTSPANAKFKLQDLIDIWKKEF